MARLVSAPADVRTIGAMQIYDVAAYHIRGLVKGLSALEVDVDAVLREAFIARASLDDPEARFSEPQMMQLWLAVERRWQRPEPFGLLIGTRIPYGALELIDYLIAACASVSEGIETLVRYASLCASGFYYSVERCTLGEVTAMRVRLHHHYGVEMIPPGVVVYLWTALIWRFREHGSPLFRPLLHMRQPTPSCVDLYQQILGNVRFGCEHDELMIPLEQWELENPRRDPMLSTLLARHANDVMERSIPAADFVSTVRVAIADSMRLGDVSIERAAKRVGLSERTLQRRLGEEGIAFKDLVDEVRFDFATKYLALTKLSLGQISDLLGYSEPRAFQRAFRRWSGMTPTSYRESGSSDTLPSKPGSWPVPSLDDDDDVEAPRAALQTS